MFALQFLETDAPGGASSSRIEDASTYLTEAALPAANRDFSRENQRLAILSYSAFLPSKRHALQ